MSRSPLYIASPRFRVSTIELSGNFLRHELHQGLSTWIWCVWYGRRRPLRMSSVPRGHILSSVRSNNKSLRSAPLSSIRSLGSELSATDNDATKPCGLRELFTCVTSRFARIREERFVVQTRSRKLSGLPLQNHGPEV